MSGQYLGQGEPPRRSGEKSDGKARLDSFLEGISKISPLAQIILAILALVVGSSVVAAIAVTVKIVVSSPTTNSTATSAPPGGSFPAEGPGSEVSSATGKFKIPDAQTLSYPNGVDSEIVFSYYSGTPGYLNAGPGVYLAILRGPMPVPNEAYRACENLDKNVQQISPGNQIATNTFASGDSLCAFTPNNQVSWIRFGGTTGQGGSDPILNVEMITWKAMSS
jgi:hypothetical protein